jgi:hypothetical protein
MYLPSATESCNSPTSQNPGSPFYSAADLAEIAAMNNAIAACDQGYYGVLNPSWQSFASLGPQVAYQVLNTPIGGQTGVYAQSAPANDSSAQAPASTSGSSGVQVSSPDNPLGANPGGGSPQPGVGSGKRRGWGVIQGGKAAANGKDPVQFAATFPGQLAPVQTYTGPLPPQGTAQSLVYGASRYNRTPQVGTSRPGMPQASAGYWQGSCPTPTPVQVSVSGEPAYNWSSAAGAGLTSPSGAGLAIAAILGLAAVAYLTEEHKRRKGRAA